MDKITIAQIFKEHNLEKINSIQKIDIGFTNEIYLINNGYILKVCKNENNEENFEREVFLYNYFKNKLPIPKIKVFDKSKSICDKYFMVYPKIDGDNLYSIWHLLTFRQRKNIIKQFCGILKIINKSPYEKFAKSFKINISNSWHDKMLQQIQSSLFKVEQKKILSSEFINAIKKFIEGNHHVLNEEKMALVYWDAHFDNILINNSGIVGILDFEKTEISSIDFVLDIVNKMVEHPKKFMSKKLEKFAKKEDYTYLLDWFQEFYPELFKFNNLDKRLGLYSLKQDLDVLIQYPNSTEVKQMIAKTTNYSFSKL